MEDDEEIEVVRWMVAAKRNVASLPSWWQRSMRGVWNDEDGDAGDELFRCRRQQLVSATCAADIVPSTAAAAVQRLRNLPIVNKCGGVANVVAVDVSMIVGWCRKYMHISLEYDLFMSDILLPPPMLQLLFASILRWGGRARISTVARRGRARRCVDGHRGCEVNTKDEYNSTMFSF